MQVTVSWTGNSIGRCRYGSNALWTLHGDLAGSRARRFAERVGLFFRSETAALLLDLRGAGLIDSAGASVLRGLRDSYPAFGVIGRPASWMDLPAVVRRALRELGPAPNLETALAAVTAEARSSGGEKRHHPRIPLQIPVEVLCAGRAAPGSLRDISRGGLRLALLPDGWLGELRKSGASTTLGILGLQEDPLGREITARFSPGPVPAVPVCALPGGVIGTRFSDNRPPV